MIRSMERSMEDKAKAMLGVGLIDLVETRTKENKTGVCYSIAGTIQRIRCLLGPPHPNALGVSRSQHACAEVVLSTVPFFGHLSAGFYC